MQAQKASSRFSNLEATGVNRIFLRGRSLPILVGLALLTATLILWQALLAQEHTDTQQARLSRTCGGKPDFWVMGNG